MTNREFSKWFAENYNKLLAESSENYAVNAPQMDKVNKAIIFFTENGGKIDGIDLKPQILHGGISFKFDGIFNVALQKVAEFAEIINYASAVSIDTENGEDICISMAIPDVFIEK